MKHCITVFLHPIKFHSFLFLFTQLKLFVETIDRFYRVSNRTFNRQRKLMFLFCQLIYSLGFGGRSTVLQFQ